MSCDSYHQCTLSRRNIGDKGHKGETGDKGMQGDKGLKGDKGKYLRLDIYSLYQKCVTRHESRELKKIICTLS